MELAGRADTLRLPGPVDSAAWAVFGEGRCVQTGRAVTDILGLDIVLCFGIF